MGVDGIQPEAHRRDGDMRTTRSTPRFDLRRDVVDAFAQRYVLSTKVFVRPAEFGYAPTQRLPGIQSPRDADLARSENVPTVLGDTLGTLWSSAVDGLEPGADHTEVVRYLEQVAGVSLTET